jgi:hypothetical protein
MSSYLQQENDFIIRTQKIIKQYESIQGNEKFEVTLLLNCFVGLLILPQQLWFDILPSEMISEKEWGISSSHIGFIKEGEKKDLANTARHLRNSISHYKFVVFSNANQEISSVKFLDYDNGKTKTFEATIPIANLRKFLNIFSDYMLNLMKNNK